MREIKFRGKRLDNEKWVYWYYKRLDNNHYIVSIDSMCSEEDTNTYENFFHEYDVSPETVGEFTGLKDKNGVEIYKFDIVKVDGDEYKVHLIEYDDTGACFCTVTNGVYYYKHSLRDSSKTFEVIGNKFENKDLLDNQ